MASAIGLFTLKKITYGHYIYIAAGLIFCNVNIMTCNQKQYSGNMVATAGFQKIARALG
jgi:hypothetical protein